MNLYHHILEKLKNRDNLWIILLFTLSGIVTAFEIKSIFAIMFSIVLSFLLILIYAIFTGIKSWRFELKLRELTPEQKAILFGDIIDQSKWDSSTKDALHEFLDKEK